MSYFPVPEGAFDGLPKSVGDYLVILLNWLWSAVARVTTGNLHLYADGTSGDDTNSGLSPSAPKKTIQAVFDMIPQFLRHNVAIHLTGVFTAGSSQLQSVSPVGVRKYLVIDGGAEVAIIDDNSGANYTADISSTQSIGNSGLSWTTDEHAGYIVEVLSGDAAGERRLVFSNDGTTIVPAKDFSVDPGTGATFRIVRPATEMQGGIWLKNLTGDVATGIQRLYFSGADSYLYLDNCVSSIFQLNGVISDSTNAGVGALRADRSIVRGSVSFLDPDTFTFDQNSNSNFGMSMRNARVIIADGLFGGFWCSFLKDAHISGIAASFSFLMGQGSRITDGLQLTNYGTARASSAYFADGVDVIKDYAGYQVCSISNSSGVGLLIQHSEVKLGDDGDISNCSSHGIEVDHSKLLIRGNLAGSGNGGGGVYAHAGSFVEIDNGDPPTLTGNMDSGTDLTFNGTTEASSWATIDAGTPASDPTEMSMAKEV
jgi:hypothetical protein